MLFTEIRMFYYSIKSNSIHLYKILFDHWGMTSELYAIKTIGSSCLISCGDW